jgi:hypothetical protein
MARYFTSITLILFLTLSPAFGEETFLGSKDCGECHTQEVKIWKKSAHYRTFRELHRRKKAKEISKKLGIKRLRSEGACLDCHYSSTGEKNKRRAVEGVSCESCHGNAKHWLDPHSSYGTEADTKESETEAHKKQRLATVDKAGMLRRDHMYEFSATCYRCHTTPNERLVNVGGHPAGSDFELLSWLEGEVLHNVFYSNDSTNADLSIERRRKLYIVGLALDAEYALRGIAGATKKDTYAKEMAQRAQGATRKLFAVSKKVKIAELAEMISLFKGVKLSLGNSVELNRAADKLATINKKFVRNHTGKELSAIDSFLPKQTDAKGKRLR